MTTSPTSPDLPISQSDDNPVLWRRLELLGDREFLRLARPPDHTVNATVGAQPI